MNPNHAKFLNHLGASEPARWRVARWLISRGYSVRLIPMTKAGSREQWRDHADAGDLEINQRVEVKQLSCEFTCAEDWPYRPKFIVCAKHAFDLAHPKPYGFVILNAKMSHAAMVMAATAKTWTVEVRQDSRYDAVAQEFYFCPMENVIFAPLEGAD